jgi:hypothetical protein
MEVSVFSQSQSVQGFVLPSNRGEQILVKIVAGFRHDDKEEESRQCEPSYAETPTQIHTQQ